jgi:hypothetical protein
VKVTIFHLNASRLFSDSLKFFLENLKNRNFQVSNYEYKDILILDLQAGCRADIYLLGEGVIGEDEVVPGHTVVPEILKECGEGKIIGFLEGDSMPNEFESRGAVAFSVDSNSNDLISLLDSLLRTE